MSNEIFSMAEMMIKRLLQLFLLIPHVAWAGFVPPVTILIDHRDIEIHPNAGFTRTNEWMVRIETPQGIEQSGQAKLYYDGKRAKQTVIEAYTIKPNGEKVMVDPNRIKVRASDADELAPYFSDQMSTIIIYPQVEVGSKLYYKAVTQQPEPVIRGKYSAGMFFTPHRRYENTSIRLTHPSELKVLTSSRDVAGKRFVLPDGRIQYVYKFHQDTAYPPEPDRVELSDFAPGVQFSTYADYADLASTFQGLFQPKTKVTPRVKNLAEKLTQRDKTNQAKAKSLYNWVSANIRYVGVDVGASGYEPHTADEILSNRYGDCKDHVVLLEALMMAVGIPSTPALINLSDEYRLRELAGTNFDHVITYVPELDLYLDSTSQFAEFGTLAPGAQGKPTVLLVTGETSSTPNSNSKKDFTVTHTKLTMLPDGRIKGSTVYTPHGSYVSNSRSAQFSYEDKENHVVVDSILSRNQETGTGEIEHGNSTDLSMPWEVTSIFELDPVINLPGPSAFRVPIGLAPGYIRAHAKERQVKNRRFPYVCGSDSHLETTEITFPDNVKVTKIPEGVTIETDSMSYKSSYQLNSKTLLVKRELTIENRKDACNPLQDVDAEQRDVLSGAKRDLLGQIFISNSIE